MTEHMFFTAVTDIGNILFKGWNTHTWKDVCLSAFLICILTIMFEGLKSLESYIKLRQCKRYSVSVVGGDNDNNELGIEITSMNAELISTPSSSGLEKIRRKKFILYLYESLIHVFNKFFGYIFMILVMTYSIWFLMAVVVGSAAGFFISHPVMDHLTSKYASSKDKQEDHCSGKVDGHQERFNSISTLGIHQGQMEQESVVT